MTIRDELHAIIAQLHTPAQLRQFAVEARRAADHQERIAAAMERRGETMLGGSSTRLRGQGRKPGRMISVRPEVRDGFDDRVRVVIGRGLWFAMRDNLDTPALRSVQRVAIRWDNFSGEVWLEATVEGDGYAVTIGSGAPRFFVGQELREHLPADGTYAGRVESTRIVFT